MIDRQSELPPRTERDFAFLDGIAEDHGNAGDAVAHVRAMLPGENAHHGDYEDSVLSGDHVHACTHCIAGENGARVVGGETGAPSAKSVLQAHGDCMYIVFVSSLTWMTHHRTEGRTSRSIKLFESF